MKIYIKNKHPKIFSLIKKVINIREHFIYENIKKSNYQKHVLISYIVSPLYSPKETHSNIKECMEIINIFDKMGYAIDLVHYTNNRTINYEKYDVIFGFGRPYEDSFRQKSKISRIYYATGAHPNFQNNAEVARIISYNQRHKANLLPQRIVTQPDNLGINFSDGLICLGNDWTKSTFYNKSSLPIEAINATYINSGVGPKSMEQISSGRNDFLWFGGSGSVHKGLDICLDYFSIKPELRLHVCGAIENDFLEQVNPVLRSPNIHYYGFVDVDSNKFRSIIERCTFSVLPSCSEGQATSVLTTMACGLIPLCTMQCGINMLHEKCMILDTSVEALDFTISTVLEMSSDDLLVLSNETYEYTRNHHNIKSYSDRLKSTISTMLAEL